MIYKQIVVNTRNFIIGQSEHARLLKLKGE